MKPIPITIRQLDYVIATAEGGSTASAARLLNVSQPSVSLAIAKVEQHLGHPLFARTLGQGVVLTPFGQYKLAEFKALRSQAGQILGAEGSDLQTLNLGVFSTLGPRYAPSLVRGFLNQNPKVEVRFHEANLPTLTAWLESGQVDVALMYEFGLPSTLDVIPLADVRPYGLLPQTHRLASRQAVTMIELLQDPLILVNLPHSRSYFLTLAQINGITPRIAHETESLEMLRSMVANGLGVGLLATDIPHDTAYDGQSVVRMPLKGTLTPHRIALVKSGRLQTSNLTKRFCQFTTQFFGA